MEVTVNQPSRLLRLPQVVQKVGYCRTQVYCLEARGEFPKRVKLGARAVAWRESEVDQWIASRQTPGALN